MNEIWVLSGYYTYKTSDDVYNGKEEIILDSNEVETIPTQVYTNKNLALKNKETIERRITQENANSNRYGKRDLEFYIHIQGFRKEGEAYIPFTNKYGEEID